jgi:phosphohistidine swiveling domain-containing protein/CRISPR/Cas system-associated endoribonuclease Cas2
MLNLNKRQFRWGPIPGKLLSVSHWTAIYYWYKRRLHHYYWPESYIIFYKKNMLFLNDMKKLEVMGEKVFEEIILTNKRKKIWQTWLSYRHNLFNFCKKINKQYLQTLTTKELQQAWTDLNQFILLFWEPNIIPELGAYGSEPLLKKLIDAQKINEEEKRGTLTVLSAPAEISFYQEEEIDLLKLATKYHQPNFKKLLTRHQQQYFWLQNSYFSTEVLGQRFFLDRIKSKIKKHIKPNRDIRLIYRHLKQTVRQKNKILAQLKNKKRIKKVSGGLAFCIWWQDQRKKYIFQYLHYLDLFVKEFSRRTKVSAQLLDFAWPEEMTTRPSRQLIKNLQQRSSRPFVVHFSRNHKRNIYGKFALNIFKKLWREKQTSVKDQFSGVVVYGQADKIKGSVFIIKNSRDIKKFPPGRILVTSMTAPEYITAIRKAKAIVTDAGGLTCHAAIVSRELKIPCIVGTKIATQVFKDEDKVEVDANNGIIRKIGQ